MTNDPKTIIVSCGKCGQVLTVNGVLMAENAKCQILTHELYDEKEWWMEDAYCKEANGNCDLEGCWHTEYKIEKIVEEAVRKGREQTANEITSAVLRELALLIRPETMRAYLAKMEENKESVGHCDYPSLAELLVDSRKKTHDYRCHHKSI